MHEIYKLLLKYGLDKLESIHKRLQRIPERRLVSFLESYAEIAEKRPLVTRAPIGATDIYPDSRSLPLSLGIIRQLAVYARKIYIHDPLLVMSHKWKHLDNLIPLIVKFQDRNDRVAHFRHELADEISKLIVLQPLIDTEIIHLTPSELIQFTKEPGKIYSDDLYGTAINSNDVLGKRKTLQDLPPEIVDYIQNHLQTHPARYIDNEPVILTTESLSPRNMIAMGFPGDVAKLYQLLDIAPAPDSNDDEMRIQMHFDMRSEDIVDPTMFANWVNGSKYELVSEILSRLQNDLTLASIAQAKFITTLESSRDLALLSLGSNPAVAPNNVTSALLQFELPFFEKADFISITKARQNETAFAEFVVAMDKAFSEIEALPNTPEFQRRVDQVYRDLLVAPLAKISRQMNVLQRNLFLDAAILIGSFAATFITQGNTLVTAAALLAATKVAEMYKQDKSKEDEIKQIPSFFYWDTIRKSKRR